MNVLVYSDKGKKPKKRSGFNSVYNKTLKMTLAARKAGRGRRCAHARIATCFFHTEQPALAMPPLLFYFLAFVT